MASPSWSAARSGLLGDTGAVNASAGINQFFGTHPMNVLYQGASILTPNGSGGTAWGNQLSTQDISQPFTMSGTVIGRVVVPVLPVGNGADLAVSLCANNAGVPSTVLQMTVIPKEWISQLAGVSGIAGPSSQSPVVQFTGNTLAVPQFNNFHITQPTTTNWPFPSAAAGVTLTTGSQAFTGNYFISVGGVSAGPTTYYSNVYTIECDSLGNMAQAIPQPSLPSVNAGDCCVTVVTDPSSGTQTVVVAGGATNTGTGAGTSTVFAGQFNSATGNIASWSTQTSLPQGLLSASAASWNGYVYVVGGTNAGQTADLQTVYYAQVSNGQITAWSSGTPIPAPNDSFYLAAINGFLVLFGGESFNGATTYNQCYYAAINGDGSIGTWQTGPSMPAAITQFATSMPTLGSYGVLAVTNTEMFMLGFGSTGPDISWQEMGLSSTWFSVAAVPGLQDGDWIHYGVNATNYITHTVSYTPRISIPLPTTGLTNGTTYHVVLQQIGSDINNYLRLHDDLNVFSGNPTLLTRPKGSTTWTAGTSGHAVPIQIYDQTVSGQPWHIWSDGGERVGTFIYSTTPDQRMIGLLDATQQPGPVLNQNPTFTNGTAPWGANNGTLVQSNSFTHSGLPFSGKFTPTGGFTQAYIESELITIALQQSYVATCWFYSSTGYSNCNIQINWYGSTGFAGYISSAVGATTSVAAGTWTQLTVTGTAPTNAVFGTVGVYEHGTPPNTAIFYASAVTLQNTIGTFVTSVIQFNWSTVFPSQLGLPLGITTLV